MEAQSRKEVVLPFELGVFNVLLTVFSELIILTVGFLFTKQLYAVLIKRRVHNGRSARLSDKNWLKYLPFGDDLVFDGKFPKLLCAAIRVLLIILTLISSIEIGSKRSFQTLGPAEQQLMVNQDPRTNQWNYGQFILPALAKQGCEQINSTHITYKATLFSQKLGTFTCRSGSFGEEEDMIILKWDIDGIPSIAQPFNVRHNVFNYTTRTFTPSNVTRLMTGDGHYLEFRKAGTRYFLFTTVRQGVSIEIVKPRLEDIFVYTANQINHDRANNVAPAISVARSFSNHAVWSKNSTKLMTGLDGKELATMSIRGIIAASVGAFVVFILLPSLLLILRRNVSYIRLDPTDAIGIASLCVEDPDRRCLERLHSIEFAITNRGWAQHLGILPKSTSAAKRDKTKSMCTLPVDSYAVASSDD